jgi:hypothetical protein
MTGKAKMIEKEVIKTYEFSLFFNQQHSPKGSSSLDALYFPYFLFIM